LLYGYFSMPFLCLEEGCARYGKDLGNAFNLDWHNNRKHNGPDDARWPKSHSLGVKSNNAVKPFSQMLTKSGARNRKRQRTAGCVQRTAGSKAMQHATGEIDMTDTLAAVANLHKKRVDATSLAQSLNGGETVRKLQDEAVRESTKGLTSENFLHRVVTKGCTHRALTEIRSLAPKVKMR
jgi:hypothetical protein